MRQTRTTPDKSLVLVAAMALWVILSAGCNEQVSGKKNNLDLAERPSDAVAHSFDEIYAETDRDLDWGDDWDRQVNSGLGIPSGRSTATANRQPPGGANPATYRPGEAIDRPEKEWVVVLKTFTSDTHLEASNRMLGTMRQLFPTLRDLRVHSNDMGSMVVYGHGYQSVDDEALAADLKMIKELEYRGRRMLPTAMASRIYNQRAMQGPHPGSLRALRQRFPNVNPLYTLEVASWSDFDSGELSLEQIHRAAEAYAAQLRGQRIEAYFYHDNDRRISVVTVGSFDRTDVDAESSLLSTKLENLMKRFPAHLVNGEELREPIYHKYPERGTRLQEPRLVEVPRS